MAAGCSKKVDLNLVEVLNKRLQSITDDDIKSNFGSALIEKVYEDLKGRNEKKIVSAWGSNLDKVGEEICSKITEDLKNLGSLNEVCSVCYGDDGEDGQVPLTKERIIIPPVEANPPMIYWIETKINIPTPDSKYLTNVPFLGDNNDKKNEKFAEELVDMYGGNLHTDCPDSDWSMVPETVDIISFIRVLMEINTKYGETIFSERPGSTMKPSSSDLQEIYEYVDKADEKVYVAKKPPLSMLEAVWKAVAIEAEPNDWLKRYLYLVRSRNPEFDNLAKFIPPNVDAADDQSVVRNKEVQMDSYKSLFCRLCFKYACIKHDQMMTKDEIDAIQTVVRLERNEPPQATTSKKTTKRVQNGKGVCKSKNCCKTNQPETIPSSPAKQAKVIEKLMSKWKPIERTMFNCHYDSIKDYCIVASLLNSKTCMEVMTYHRYSNLLPKYATGHEVNAVGEEDIHTRILRSPSTPGSSGYESLTSPSCHTANATDEVKQEVEGEIYTRELSTFIPCSHENGICDETCHCVSAKKRCETTCGCFKTCKNRFKGCVCLTTCDSKRCPCFVQLRECNPDLCKNCGAHEIDKSKISCKNVALQRRQDKSISVRKSNVSGWGCFADEDIKKGDFIIEYTAEMISGDESEKRGHVYDEKRHTYLFGVTDTLTLDASRMGNKCRFINSSRRPNCQPLKMIVRGETRLAIKAVKDINKDGELFFNYHNVLKPNSKNKSTKRSRKYVEDK